MGLGFVRPSTLSRGATLPPPARGRRHHPPPTPPRGRRHLRHPLRRGWRHPRRRRLRREEGRGREVREGGGRSRSPGGGVRARPIGNTSPEPAEWRPRAGSGAGGARAGGRGSSRSADGDRGRGTGTVPAARPNARPNGGTGVAPPTHAMRTGGTAESIKMINMERGGERVRRSGPTMGVSRSRTVLASVAAPPTRGRRLGWSSPRRWRGTLGLGRRRGSWRPPRRERAQRLQPRTGDVRGGSGTN